MGLFGKVKGKLGAKMAGAITATLLKRAAEGKFGPEVQKVYWALKGSKTKIGAWLLFFAGVVKAGQESGVCDAFGLGLECAAVADSVAQATAGAATLFLYLGQVDGGLATEPPRKG